MKTTLSGVNILVTRPQAQGLATCASLEEQGATVSHIPTVAICANPALPDLLIPDKPIQAVIVLSKSVIPYAENEITQLQQQGRVQHWLAIGAGSQTKLAEFIPETITTPENASSEGLLELACLQTFDQTPVILYTGTRGRQRLSRVLRARGAEVIIRPVYRRTLTDSKPAMRQNFTDIPPKYIVVTSNACLKNLFKLVPRSLWPQIQHSTIVVVSKRGERFAQRLGCQNIIVSIGASADKLTSRITEHYNDSM